MRTRILLALVSLLACGPGREGTSAAESSPGQTSAPPTSSSLEAAEPAATPPSPELTQEELERLALQQAEFQRPPSSPSTEGTSPPAAGPTSSPPADRPPEGTTPPPGPDSPPPRPPLGRFLRGREYLLQVKPGEVGPVARDFRIGALSGGLPVRTEDPEVITVMEQFLQRLARGEVARALVSPVWVGAISRPLEEVLRQGWPEGIQWRLGELVWESETLARAPFILRQGKRWAAGVIYAEKARNRYAITDVVVDLLDLRRDRPEEKFEPDTYPILSPLP